MYKNHSAQGGAARPCLNFSVRRLPTHQGNNFPPLRYREASSDDAMQFRHVIGCTRAIALSWQEHRERRGWFNDARVPIEVTVYTLEKIDARFVDSPC